jgi:hypothetical protein
MVIIDVGSGYKYEATEAGVNAAISDASSGDTVYVHAAIIYVEDHININKSIVFRGESWDTTKFYLGTAAGGKAGLHGTSDGAIKITANNVECCYFQVWGYKAIKSDDIILGGGHGDTRNAIFVDSVSDCKFHNVYVKRYVHNDAIRFRYAKNCQVYDCILEGNHDTISFLHSSNIKVKNCKLFIATNTGMRWYYASSISVSYVTVDGNNGGQSCFEMQVQNGTSSIERCLIKNTNIPFFTYSQGNCMVSNTVICKNTGSANCTGTNIITGADPNTNWESQGYGYNGSNQPLDRLFARKKHLNKN